MVGGGCIAGAASASPPLLSFSGSFGCAGGCTGGAGSSFTGLTGEAFLSFLGDLVSLSLDLLLFLLGSAFFSGTSLLASTPMLVATASIACREKLQKCQIILTIQT